MPSKKQIYRDDLSYDKLPPTIITKKFDDNTKYNFCIKKLSTVIGIKIEDELNARDIPIKDLRNVKRFELSYNADHGGNHFCIVIRCRLI